MKRFPLLAALILSGCGAHHPVEAWRFNRCVQNGDHYVCDCSRYHEQLNAKTGQKVAVCD